MKQAFYIRFFKYLHNEMICVFLSNCAYMLYCMLFLFKKVIRKKQYVTMSEEDAERLLSSVYPQPESHPKYVNPIIKEDLDLSIVVPVYNYADILDDNIQSILNQKTKFHFEVIFVDDGSTDGARDILRKYENYQNVKLIFQKNGGIGSARNTGIDNASGKYIMFVDCDDTVHDNMVEILMSKAYEKDLDMVIAAHNLVKERNKKVYSVLPNIYPQSNLIGYKNGDVVMNYPGLPWAKVYKRELWEKVRFFPGYWYEDTIIQLLIFTQVKSYSYIPTVVYEYKWYEKNFSHTQNNAKQLRTIERYWLLKEIIERYEELELSKDAQFYTLLLTHFSAYYYPYICEQSPDIVDALFVLAKKEIDKYRIEGVKLPFIISQVEKAFQKSDKSLWGLASCYQ